MPKEWWMAVIGLWKTAKILGNGDWFEGIRKLIKAYGNKELSGEAAIATAKAADYLLDEWKHLLPPGVNRVQVGQELIRHFGKSLKNRETRREELSVGVLLNDIAWFESGMPSIEIGHKLAASFMLTSVPKDIVEELRMPFHSFELKVPDGLLTMLSAVSGLRVDTRRIRLAQIPVSDGVGYFFMAENADGSDATNISDTLTSILSADKVEHALKHEEDELREDNRNAVLANRLLTNVILYLNNGGERKTVGKGRACSRQRGSPEPIKRVFRLTQKVTHDFRQVVYDYSTGKSHRLTVQSIVIGHWRMQPCGPKSSERKRLFIEPYWRGPEDAPIALRPHHIG